MRDWIFFTIGVLTGLGAFALILVQLKPAF